MRRLVSLAPCWGLALTLIKSEVRGSIGTIDGLTTDCGGGMLVKTGLGDTIRGDEGRGDESCDSGASLPLVLLFS